MKGKYFALNRFGNSTAYLRENNDLTLGALAFDKAQKCYWQFEETGKTGCYYIKNATSGLYIQSTKRGLSQQVPTGNQPVEFKIAKDETPGAATRGYYYLCSTDQNISNATDGTLGLNYANGSVVAFHIKTGRGNSYWEITEVPYEYEVPPFAAVPEITNEAEALKYTLLTESGSTLACVDGKPVLESRQADPRQSWFFAGTGNAREGYLIVSGTGTGQTLNTDGEGDYKVETTDIPTRWFVKTVEKDGYTWLSFIPHSQKENQEGHLTVNGDSLFRLDNYRSAFSLASQIYFLPCGTKGEMFLNALSVTGRDVLKELHYASTGQPAGYYTLYTRDKGRVAIGRPFHLQLDLGQTAPEGMIHVYFDWNADGVFETAYSYEANSQLEQDFPVPDTAREGKTRMRIRLTANGLQGAEDDVWGATYDFILDVAPPQEDRTVIVRPNGSGRGRSFIRKDTEERDTLTAAYGEEITVEAVPQGNAAFIGWRQGHTIVSTQPVYTFTLTENKELEACFSPNTRKGTDAVTSAERKKETDFTYTTEPGVIKIRSNAPLHSAALYGSNGIRMRRSTHNELSTLGLPRDTYILKVQTAAGESGKKIVLP